MQPRTLQSGASAHGLPNVSVQETGLPAGVLFLPGSSSPDACLFLAHQPRQLCCFFLAPPRMVQSGALNPFPLMILSGVVCRSALDVAVRGGRFGSLLRRCFTPWDLVPAPVAVLRCRLSFLALPRTFQSVFFTFFLCGPGRPCPGPLAFIPGWSCPELRPTASHMFQSGGTSCLPSRPTRDVPGASGLAVHLLLAPRPSERSSPGGLVDSSWPPPRMVQSKTLGSLPG